MGNCGSSSGTEARAPAGPIMVPSHYRLSPGGERKKVVHAGLQVLSTRHCGTTGGVRKEHYVHNLWHAIALNYLYVAMLAFESVHVLCVTLTCAQLDVYTLSYLRWCQRHGEFLKRGGGVWNAFDFIWFDSSDSFRDRGVCHWEKQDFERNYTNHAHKQIRLH